MSIDLNTKLSQNFTLREFTRSQAAARRGIDNSPTEDVVTALKAVCVELELVRAIWVRPVVITSGYRCPDLNRAIGGSATSQHQYGQAVDFEIVGVSNLDVWSRVANGGDVDYDQLILEFHDEGDPQSGWVHLSTAGGANRRQAFKIGGSSRDTRAGAAN